MRRKSEAKHKKVTHALPPGYDWALRGVADNITTTKDGVQAWFALRPVDWNYRSNEQCEAEIDRQVRFWLALAGRDFHLRSLMLPYPVSAWARNLDLNTPEPVNRDAWVEHLRIKQRRLRGSNLGETITFVGVTLGGRNAITSVLDRFRDGAQREAVKMADEIEVLTGAIAGAARPATQREVEWLLHQSRGLGLPTPMASSVAGKVPLDPYDLAGIYEAVEVDPGPLGSRAIRLTATAARTGGRDIDRWVSVLSVGRMEPLVIPEKDSPWLAYATQFPGAELSVRGTVLSGPDAAKAIEEKIKLVRDQAPQYAQHGVAPPPNLHRVYENAVRLQDEMEESHAKDAARVYGHVRIAVSAPTQEEVIAKAQKLRAHFEQINAAVEQPRNQEGLYREFTPGEPLSTTAHLRRMRVRMFAAGVPQVTATIGDRQGSHFGRTIGVVSTPFMWDQHLGMEDKDQSGLTPVVGGLGSGKSNFLGGSAAYSTLRGISTTILDPSGPLARIAEWGPIKDQSAVVDLLRSDNGALSPFAVIPEPRKDAYDSDEEYAEARKIAAIERKALAVDVMRACLPTALNRDPRTEVLLQQAVRSTEGRGTSSLAVALTALRAMEDEHAAMLHSTLMEISEHPHARLFFTSGYMTQYRENSEQAQAVDKTLLVLTMGGLTLPDPTHDRDTWSLSERLAVPLLSLAAHYTSSRIYRQGRHVRKVVALDETHFMAGWPSGRALLARLERDSRKWNTRVFTASQDTVTALASQQASKALISDAIIFNISGAEPAQQRGGLELLQVPLGMGFERVLSGLRPADDDVLTPEQKWRDALVRINGKVNRVRFDFADHPDLRELLITTPARGESGLSDLATGTEWFA